MVKLSATRIFQKTTLFFRPHSRRITRPWITYTTAAISIQSAIRDITIITAVTRTVGVSWTTGHSVFQGPLVVVPIWPIPTARLWANSPCRPRAPTLNRWKDKEPALWAWPAWQVLFNSFCFLFFWEGKVPYFLYHIPPPISALPLGGPSIRENTVICSWDFKVNFTNLKCLQGRMIILVLKIWLPIIRWNFEFQKRVFKNALR